MNKLSIFKPSYYNSTCTSRLKNIQINYTINERKCYRMHVALINHDIKIIDMYLIKEIYCQFAVKRLQIYFSKYENIFEGINVKGLVAIRIEDDHRRTSLEM